MTRPSRLRRPLTITFALAFFMLGGGACAVEDGIVGACVEDGPADACTQARAGRCTANARFVVDESCETLGFTFACATHAGAAVDGARALVQDATWVRSAATCSR